MVRGRPLFARPDDPTGITPPINQPKERRSALKSNPIPEPTFAERMERQRENLSRFEVYRSLFGEQLPAPVVVATPERVYVTVADTDDLLPWLGRCGGFIRRGPVFDGMQTWTLHLVADGWSDGRAVPVQITAVVHEHARVMCDLLDALVPAADVVPRADSPMAVSA